MTALSQSSQTTVALRGPSPVAVVVPAKPDVIAEPEEGTIGGRAYNNDYFSLTYPLPDGWSEGLPGPTPSEDGYYVLRSLKPAENFRGRSKGTILIAAWDLFFVPGAVANALDFVKDAQAHLPDVYKALGPVEEVKIAGRSFAELSYSARVANLSWKVLATDVRCHMVEFVFTSSDRAVLDSLIQGMSRIKLPEEAGDTSGTGGGDFPVCVKGYAEGNVLHRVEPAMAEPRFTKVPVRIIIGPDGKVKHVHVIRGSEAQSQSIQNALSQWLFRPYLRNGVPTELETGILFKFPPDGTKLPPVPEKY